VRGLAAKIKGAGLDIVPGMGHDLPLPLLRRVAEGIAVNAARVRCASRALLTCPGTKDPLIRLIPVAAEVADFRCGGTNPSIVALQREPPGTRDFLAGISNRATKVPLAASITWSTLCTVASKRPPPTATNTAALVPGLT
jgi:hypothetical protein